MRLRWLQYRPGSGPEAFAHWRSGMMIGDRAMVLQMWIERPTFSRVNDHPPPGDWVDVPVELAGQPDSSPLTTATESAPYG